MQSSVRNFELQGVGIDLDPIFGLQPHHPFSCIMCLLHFHFQLSHGWNAEVAKTGPPNTALQRKAWAEQGSHTTHGVCISIDAQIENHNDCFLSAH